MASHLRGGQLPVLTQDLQGKVFKSLLLGRRKKA